MCYCSHTDFLTDLLGSNNLIWVNRDIVPKSTETPLKRGQFIQNYIGSFPNENSLLANPSIVCIGYQPPPPPPSNPLPLFFGKPPPPPLKFANCPSPSPPLYWFFMTPTPPPHLTPKNIIFK